MQTKNSPSSPAVVLMFLPVAIETTGVFGPNGQ